MEESQPRVFSVRIVSVDYYMTPPVPGLDVSSTSLHGGQVNQVPVIRIYGSTPAGQKTCLHIHRVLPYLYIPWSDLGHTTNDEVDSRAYSLSFSLDKALKLKTNAGQRQQHVHGYELVRAWKFYGYHSSEELFIKIYFYYPQDVSRAAKLLLLGAVRDMFLQPYESHIPFLLQFLIDYNLYGMSHLHVSKLKFRCPIPDIFNLRRGGQNSEVRPLRKCSTSQELKNLGSNKSFWTSSTIPDGWVWQDCPQPDSLTDEDILFLRRQSTCELEGDAVADDIINQQFISYSPLSATHSGVKMVQSLIPIWEEEHGRNGAPEELPPEPGRPLTQDVLSILSDGLKFGDFLGIKDGKESWSQLSSESLESLIARRDLSQSGLPEIENSNALPSKHVKASERSRSLLSQGSPLLSLDAAEDRDIDVTATLKASGSGGLSCSKVAEVDAVRLLKWLASSQAMGDIDSDDELNPETIFSPLLPKDIEKVLDRASVECERESQKECQDILDSIDMPQLKELDARAFVPAEFKYSNKVSLNEVIPQVDGSSDDPQFIPCLSKLVQTDPVEAKRDYEIYPGPEIGSSSTIKHIGKRPRWGYLPVSSKKLIDFSMSATSSVPGGCSKEKKGLSTSRLGNETEKLSKITSTDEKKFGQLKQNSMLVECSLRDLMRKKRLHQLQNPKDGITAEKMKEELTLEDDDTEKGDIYPEPYIVNDSADGKTLTSKYCKESNVVESSCSYYLNSKKDPPLASRNTSINLGNRLKKNDLSLIAGFCLLNNAPDSKAIVGEHFDSNVPQAGGLGSTTEFLKGLGETGYESSVTEIKMQVSVDDENASGNKTTGYIGLENLRDHDQNIGLSNPLYTSKNMWQEAETIGLITMTFSRKPPCIDCMNNSESDVPYLLENEFRQGGTSLPFFVRNCTEEELKSANSAEIEHQDARPENHEDIKHDCVVGVPVTHQYDGSCSYMLGFARSPPSRESVDMWLSSNGSNTFGKGMDTPSSQAKGSSNNMGYPDCFQQNDQDFSLKEFPFSDEKMDIETLGATKGNVSCEVTPTGEICMNVSPGILSNASQISGPAIQTSSTLSSQMGFRDPASEGQGQQLTLISIEVQAESRGDLRPDPQIDAVNVIVLICQEDDEDKLDSIVLLCCNSASAEKDIDAISESKVLVFTDELQLLDNFKRVICSLDPDILMGWDVQSGSLGFLAERAAHLHVGLLSNISRTPSSSFVTSELASGKGMLKELLSDSVTADSSHLQDTIIDDDWGRTHASGVHVGGRIVLNVWRLMRNEIKHNMYTVEAIAETVLKRKIPCIPWRVLTKWFMSGPGQARYRAIQYTLERAKLNLQIINQLDMINRTSELARVFGIDFFSVLSRGSQYRVESMLLRLAHTQNYLAISPGNHQVANQPAMECLPIVMEPESRFYADPVVVLDFQSLYPSMVIAYNLCFCTCLGQITPGNENVLGVCSYIPPAEAICSMKHELLVTPNGVAYVPKNVRRGILPRLLEEILSTRIMVKQAMKKLAPSHRVRQRILNARQLALKLIANVTYGYTAAGFSGRMPCAELADSIVQCGRRTLETAISFVNSNEKWNGRVIYGDTDSMFVLLKGRSLQEAFRIGQEIASAITEMNPAPIKLKMEKVYYPCFLLTKKRYVGYSYESPDQSKPTFDAKGIETVRRDTCGAVSKFMEQSLKMYFESQNIDEVKAYLQRQWKRILTGRVSLQDFIFAKEVRLGTYSERAYTLPPAAIVAMKSMRDDPRAEPRYAERVPYIVVHGEPGSRLADMVVDPHELLDTNSPLRLNDVYYITKQIIPALQRVFGLIGADLNQWFLEMPRIAREYFGKQHPLQHRTRIDYYYTSKHCILCGNLVEGSTSKNHLCHDCRKDETSVCIALTGRSCKLERDIQHLNAICRHCGGGDWCVESGVKCVSLACPVFFERRKVQNQLHSLSQLATAKGYYPKCTVDWF